MARFFKSVMDFLTFFNVAEVNHLYGRHMNKSLKYVMNRNVLLSSTFVTEKNTQVREITPYIFEEAEIYASDIHDWLSDIKDWESYLLFAKMPKNWHGVLYVDGRLYDCNEFVVVLNKVNDGSAFVVSTIYPCSTKWEHLVKVQESPY